MPADSSSTYRIEAIAAALDIFETYLTSQQPVLGVTELSQRTGLDKSRVYRILRTLLERGYVDLTEERTYRLGLKLFELGDFIKEQMDLRKIAEPELVSLAQRCGDTVLLNVRDGGEAVCIAEYHGDNPLQVSQRVRKRSKVYAGGSPKVLLAFAPELERDALLRELELAPFTPNTIRSREKLLASLAQIRDQGYAVNIEELDIGVCAVAAPVRDHTGAVVASVSIAGPKSQFDLARRQRLIEWVVECTQRISKQHGYLGG